MNEIAERLRALAEKHPERAKSLIDMLRYQIELENKSNQEIAGLLLREVWAKMDMKSRASSIVGEAIDRLRGDK